MSLRAFLRVGSPSSAQGTSSVGSSLSVRSFVWLGISINIQGVSYAGALTSFDTALFGSQQEGDKLLRHDPNSYWIEK